TTTVTLRLSPTKQAGLTANKHVQMFAPNPFQGGSSVSHWNDVAYPNLSMEPAINSDLTDSIDLTDALFRDIGWLPRLLAVPPPVPAPRVALQARPNPASATGSSVHFELAENESVSLTLYDLAGREVRSLAKGAFGAGPHDVPWDGLDA